MMPVTRQILGYQDFPKNLQKILFGHFSNAARKPSKNPQKTFGRPPKMWKTLQKPSKNRQKTLQKPSKNPSVPYLMRTLLC